MRLPAALSCLLHLLVVALLVFGLPLLQEERLDLESAVAVNVVTLASITNAPPPSPPAPVQTAQAQPTPPKPLPPKPEPVPVPPPPPPPPPPVPPPPLPPEPKPEPPKPEPPKPEPKPEPPKPEPKPEPPKPEPPKSPPPPPPPPPPKPEPKKPDLLEQLSKAVQQPQKDKPKPPDLLDQLSKAVQQPQKDQKASPRPAPPSSQVASNAANYDSTQPLSGTEEDAIRGGVQQCWNFDNGLLNAKDLVVKLRVTVTADGRYGSAEILDAGRARSDPVFRSAAEAARRAVLNAQCNKIPLPPDRLARLMPSFVLNFNPKDMF